METKLVFLMLTIIILWLLVNPKSREWIKAMTGSVFGGAAQVDNLPRGTTGDWRSTLQFMPAHGPAYQAQTAGEAVSYIGTHLIYVAVFIFLTLVMYWTVGSKGTFWFLVLVLLGQLLFNIKEIQALLPKG